MTTPVHKIEVFVVEYNDQYGIEEVKLLIEQAIQRYALVSFGSTQTKDVGEWSDAHPLNFASTDASAYFESLEAK